MANKKRLKATLFDLHVFMNEKGDVELEIQSVSPEDFTETMDSEMPHYDGTYKVASLIRFLRSIGEEVREKAGRYV
jgi:hypothetical protein